MNTNRTARVVFGTFLASPVRPDIVETCWGQLCKNLNFAIFYSQISIFRIARISFGSTLATCDFDSGLFKMLLTLYRVALDDQKELGELSMLVHNLHAL